MVYSSNTSLTLEEMTVNAQYILNYLLGEGWSKNAVCGMLGNMQTESWINPGVWQSFQSGNMSGGYGLVQWTPASKYVDWANSNGLNHAEMDSQLKRIIYEVENNIQWIDSNMTFQQFSVSTDTSYNLGMKFIEAYERPSDPNQPLRGEQAEYWFTNLSGEGVVYHFIYPTVKTITSGFKPDDRLDHAGVDFAEPGYHEIKASANGVVSQSYVSSSYGEVIFILHNIEGQEYETVYAHMETGSRTVFEGDNVTQGQVIGVMGNTGDSSGQHLHFELHVGRWNESKSNAVDPIPYLGVSTNPVPEPEGNNKRDKLIIMLLANTLNGW
jgi:hypothetical protein